MIVTSPPYWGLRAYGTGPQVWGGDRHCGHVWGDELRNGRRGNRGISGTGGNLHPSLDAAGPGAGSGTTLKVAMKLGRRSIGIELSEEYLKIARRRTAQLGLMT